MRGPGDERGSLFHQQRPAARNVIPRPDAGHTPRTPTYSAHTYTPITPLAPRSESGKTNGRAARPLRLAGLDPVPSAGPAILRLPAPRSGTQGPGRGHSRLPTSPFRQAHTPVHPHIEHTHTHTPTTPLAPRSESGKTGRRAALPSFRLPALRCGAQGTSGAPSSTNNVHPPGTSSRAPMRDTHPVHPHRTHTHLHPHNPPGSPIGVGEDEGVGRVTRGRVDTTPTLPSPLARALTCGAAVNWLPFPIKKGICHANHRRRTRPAKQPCTAVQMY